MALTTATNCTSPVATTKWAGADSDPYDRAEQLAGVAENFDSHDHTSGKCLGVGRVQTSAVPDAAGEVRVNDSNALVTYYANSALRTLVELDLTQTLTAKTLTSPTINSGTVGTKLSFSDAASKIVPGATSWAVRNNADNANNLFVTNGGIVGIGGVTGNAKMTKGLAIQQDGNDDEILAFKSDPTHSFTDLAETGTYASFQKASAVQGGLMIRGYRAGGTVGVQIIGCPASADATRSTSGVGAIEISGWGLSGAGGGTLGADKNILSIADYGTTRFILDSDGDSHQDVGTAWTQYDEHDDITLLNQLNAHLARPDDPLRQNFGHWLESNREHLEALKLVQFNADGHHFVNWSRTHMLVIGAVRQLADRLTSIEQGLALTPPPQTSALPGGTA